MDSEKARDIAKKVCQDEGWPWQEPILVKRVRSIPFVGRRQWRVMTNTGYMGGNANILIDDATEEVICRGFAPR